MGTFQQAADTARLVLGDPEKVRYPDDVMLTFGADCVREIAMAREDLFAVVQDVACTPGTVRQTVGGASNGYGLHVIDVQGIVDGDAITMGDLLNLRQFQPSWRNDTAGPAQNWFPIAVTEAKKPVHDFYIYPKAPNAQSLVVHFVQDPFAGGDPSISDDIPLPDEFLPAVEWYMVFRAEAGDEEHVNSNRAAQAYQMFGSIVGVEAREKFNAAAKAGG